MVFFVVAEQAAKIEKEMEGAVGENAGLILSATSEFVNSISSAPITKHVAPEPEKLAPRQTTSMEVDSDSDKEERKTRKKSGDDGSDNDDWGLDRDAKEAPNGSRSKNGWQEPAKDSKAEEEIVSIVSFTISLIILTRLFSIKNRLRLLKKSPS
jgi:hypothetical protein